MLRLDGLTDIPPGKVAAIVTFYELRQVPAGTLPANARWAAATVPRPVPKEWFRTLYRRIGEDYLWFSHAILADAELAALVDAPTTEIVTLKQDGADIGLAELDFATSGEVEIVSFGVVPAATGTGAARFLMHHTLARAFRPGVRRVWLHTCTHDHPAAVAFYRRAGFVPYRIAVEVADDPRLTGKLRRTAAPQIPTIEG